MEISDTLKSAFAQFDQRIDACDLCYEEYALLEQCAKNNSACPSVPLLQRKLRVAMLSESERRWWEQNGEKLDIKSLHGYLKTEFPTPATWLQYINGGGATEADLLQAFAQCGSNYKRGYEIFKLLVELYGSEAGNVPKLQKVYEHMLSIPHEQLEETYQAYSQFVSERFPESYSTLMRDGSRLRSKSESLSQYYIIHENRIHDDPLNPQPWIDYVESCAMHKLPETPFAVVEEVFYRSLIESSMTTDERWVPVWRAFLKEVQKYEPSRMKVFIRKAMRCLPNHPLGYLLYLESEPDEAEFPFLRTEVHRLMNREPFELHSWKKLATALLYGNFKHFSALNGSWKEPFLEDIAQAVSTAFNHEDTLDITFLAISLTKRCSTPQDEFHELFLELTTAAFDRWPTSTEVWVRCFNLLSSYAAPKFSKRMLELLPQDLGQLDDPHRAIECAIISRALNGSPEELRMLLKLQNEYHKITPKRTRSQDTEVVEEEKPPVKKVRQASIADDPSRSREIFRVKVENLLNSTTKEGVIAFFQGYCEPVSIDLHSTTSGHIALVEFGSESEVLKALVRDQKPLGGSLVSVKRVFGNTLWLSNYPSHWGPENLESYLRNEGLEFLSIRYPSQSDRKEKRFCYIDFADTASTQHAQSQLNLREIDNFTLHAEVSNPALKKKRSSPDTNHQIYVNNLNFETTTEETLLQFFSGIGKVDDVKVPLNPNNREKGFKNNGFAFVTFADSNDVKKALKVNDAVLDGRSIHVSRVKSKQALKQESTGNLKDDHTIAIFNVNTIVTQSYLEEFLSKQVGPTREVVLKPSKKAALVEFTNVGDCGRAKLILEGMLFEEDVLHVGTKSEFFKEDAPQSTKKPSMAPPMLMRRKKRK